MRSETISAMLSAGVQDVMKGTMYYSASLTHILLYPPEAAVLHLVHQPLSMRSSNACSLYSLPESR